VPNKSVLEARSWTASESDLRMSHDQGDGFYLAVFNESKIAEVPQMLSIKSIASA
jgi:hypothetical protein